MAVTKRTRYEILRRDANTCQYCGAKAPDVVLHIDHMIPVALGGSDKPDNLVTACKDCNAGKSSMPADAPLAAAVSQRSAEFALINLNRAARIEGDFTAIEEYQEEFLVKWERWTTKSTGNKIPLPDSWRKSLTAWWQISVPTQLLDHAIEVTMAANKIMPDDKFSYAAGVVWRTLDDYDARYPATTNEGRVYSDSEMENHGIDEWRRGWEGGRRVAGFERRNEDFVTAHIDGSRNPLFEKLMYARAD